MKKILRPVRNIIAYFKRNERFIGNYKKELRIAKINGFKGLEF
jgi:hypothetical protein